MRLDDRTRPSNDVVQYELEDGIVLLNMRTAACFELDPIGARLWAAIRAETKLRSVFEILLREYDVASDVLETDILALVSQLIDVGVLERSGA